MRGRTLVGRGGAAQQVFSAEIPIRMRIDMRIRHGNAIGEIGAGGTLEGAYNFFFPGCLRLLAAVVMRLGRGIKDRNFSRAKLRRARYLSAEVSFLFHSACAPGHSSSTSPINSSVQRTFGRREEARFDSFPLSLSLFLSQSGLKSSLYHSVQPHQGWHEGSSISIASPIFKKPCTLHTECPTTQF